MNSFDERLLFSGKFREALLSCPQHLLDMPEPDLVEQYDFTSTDWLLRRRFWEIVERARKHNITSYQTIEVFRDISSRQNFEVFVIQRPYKIAWLLKPIRDYKELCDQVFNVGMEKVLAYIQKSKISEANISKVIKLLEFSANRKHGPVVQRMQIHQRTENVQLDSSKDVTPQIEPQALRDQIAALSAKMVGPSDKED